jgi:hypothetical protein
MYVDDFVYFSADPAVEPLFCRLLAERCKVDFMGIVEWFLGVHFSWRLTPDSADVHLNQSGFATNLFESFAWQERNQTPTATPYRSGVPIESVAPSLDPDDLPAQLHRTEAYQSLIGSIGWLASTTRLDIAAAHSFLSSYTNKPAVGHMKAALYALHYIHSTHDYGISFTSNDTAPMHSYIHFPPSTDAEAYDDAIPPKLGSSNTISAYSDACWGSQLGNSVADGTLLPLFKFCSMNGGIVFKNGGPLGWLGERQERTSLSSCEAEIRATNATSKKVVDFRNLSRSVSDAGYVIPDIDAPTIIYNDNEACVRWSYNMTSKAARHIELRENSVRKWVQNKTIDVEHVSGKINPLCPVFRILSGTPSLTFIKPPSVVPPLLLPQLLPVGRLGTLPAIFQPSLLLPFSAILKIFHTYAALVGIFFDDFMALFLHICSSHFRLQSGPKFRWNTTFSSFFLLDTRMGGVGLSLVHFSRACRSNLELTSLTISDPKTKWLSPLTKLKFGQVNLRGRDRCRAIILY